MVRRFSHKTRQEELQPIYGITRKGLQIKNSNMFGRIDSLGAFVLLKYKIFSPGVIEDSRTLSTLTKFGSTNLQHIHTCMISPPPSNAPLAQSMHLHPSRETHLHGDSDTVLGYCFHHSRTRTMPQASHSSLTVDRQQGFRYRTHVGSWILRVCTYWGAEGTQMKRPRCGCGYESPCVSRVFTV